MSWAAVAGAAVGVVGGALTSKGGGSVVQSSDPWSGVQPYLHDLFGRGQGLLGSPSLGAQSPLTREAIGEMGRIYRDPNSSVRTAQGELGRVLEGEYLDVDKNPYVQRAAQRGIDQALIGVNSRFGPEGFGGSANREWATRIASEAAVPFYANEYGRERNNMTNAMAMAPGLSLAHLNPLLMGGELEETRSQAEVDAPWTALARYRGLLTGTPGGTTTTPYFGGNPVAGAIGGGLLGYNIGNRIAQQQPYQTPGIAGPMEGYNDFVGDAWGGGFGPAFTQQGIYG